MDHHGEVPGKIDEPNGRASGHAGSEEHSHPASFPAAMNNNVDLL
jgi:hypothetical protein